MSADELNDAALGWELVIPQGFTVHYLLAADAPYSGPTIKVITPAEARARWKHIELDGTACLRPPGQNWMPLLGGAAIDQALGALLRIIVINVRGLGEPDPVSTRHRWVGTATRVWSLLDLPINTPGIGAVERVDGNAVAARLHRRWVIAPSRENLDAWLKNRGMDADEFADALVVGMRDFEELPNDLSSLGVGERKIAERGGMVVFVLPSATGPLLVAIRLEPSGALTRIRVDRADRQWLHDRGGNGLAADVAKAHVVIVGCGSLGGGVATLLARAGVGRLTMIDPDSLSWDNVARHVLGGAAVGRAKAVELARHLQMHIPTISRVTALPNSWQHVAAEQPRALRADLIISTTAAWPDDLALAEWSRNHGVRLVVGWVEPRAAAGHAVSLQGRCLACQFTPHGRFQREIAKWTDEAPIRLTEGCHEHFLPYGYADIVPTQSLIARLSLAVLRGESVDATHWALVPSKDVLRALGALPSRDWAFRRDGAPSTAVWSEHRQEWSTNPNCWHCGGTG